MLPPPAPPSAHSAPSTSSFFEAVITSILSPIVNRVAPTCIQMFILPDFPSTCSSSAEFDHHPALSNSGSSAALSSSSSSDVSLLHAPPAPPAAASPSRSAAATPPPSDDRRCCLSSRERAPGIPFHTGGGGSFLLNLRCYVWLWSIWCVCMYVCMYVCVMYICKKKKQVARSKQHAARV